MKNDIRYHVYTGIGLLFIILLFALPKCNKQECPKPETVDMSKYILVEKYNAEQKFYKEQLEKSDKSYDECIKWHKEKNERLDYYEETTQSLMENKIFLSKRLDAKSKCAYTVFRDVTDNDYTTAEDGRNACLKKCFKSACDDFYKYFKRNED